MKKIIPLLLLVSMFEMAMGQDTSGQNSNVTIDGQQYTRVNGGQGQNQRGPDCSNVLQRAKVVYPKYLEAQAGSDQIASKALEAQWDEVRANNLQQCRLYEFASKANGEAFVSMAPSQKMTADKRVACIKRGSMTMDYQSCASTADMYNYILGLETLMRSAQESSLKNKQSQIAQDAALQTANGDGQNAALAASAADNNFKSNLSMQQAQAYGAAVAAMGMKLSGWQSNSDSALVKKCKPEPAELQKMDTVIELAGSCTKNLPQMKNDSAVFANNEAKGMFTAIMLELGAKAAAAMIAAKKFESVAKATTAAQQTTDTGTSTLDKCVTNPTLAECLNSTGNLTPGQTYGSGDFSVGDGFGTNNLGNTNLTTSGALAGDASSLPSSPVANVDNPFVDNKPGCTNSGTAAGKAACILNPADAAKVTPQGGAAGGGSGGGVGGSMGGGSASLGNDLAGQKDPKDNSDIKSNKAAGGYNVGSGQGFRGVAASKDENPFASMFDSKSSGGVEDDQSIPSNQNGVDSGLFQRLSKRYGQVQSEKRIEAVNLE